MLSALISKSTRSLQKQYESIKDSNAIAFFMAFTCMAVYCYINSNLTFRGDSYETWNVAKHFYEVDRQRSFVEYRGPFSFILYNLIYRVSQILQINDVTFLRTFTSLVFAYLTVNVFPYFFSYIFEKKIYLLERISFSAVTFYFFSGYFLYPQTDFLALIFLLLSANVLIFATNESKPSWIHYCGAGVLLACSAMTRFNYILSLPFLLLFITFGLYSRHVSRITIAKLIACFVVPMSFMIMLNSSDSNSSRLMRAQLEGGLKIQKIEWNAGDEKYPGKLLFSEKRGIELLKLEGIDTSGVFHGTGISGKQYLSLYAKYPFDMAAIAMSHLFAGVDITYDSVYVYNFHSPRILFSLLNYSLIFLALVIIFAKLSWWRQNGQYAPFLLLALAVPGFSAIPFIVEVRFFMPLILAYSAISIFALSDGIKTLYIKNLYWYLLAFILLCFLNSTNLFNSLEKVIPLTPW